ncbi:MAG: PAS domain S-box protein [Candidatus Contendobacter sp.]
MTPPPAFIPPDRAAKPAGMPLSAFLTRLIWLCVLPLVLLAAWLAINYVLTTKAERDLEAANLAKNLATAIDQHLSARIAALNMLAASPLADDPSRWKDLYQEAQDFHQGFGSHVILADLETHMLFNTRVPFGTPLPLLPRPKGRRAIDIVVETGKPAVSNILFGPVAGEPLVSITVPGLREGKTTFFVISTFELRQFQHRLDQMALPAGWSLALLDGNGDVIARRALAGFNPETAVDAAGRFVVKSTVSPWSVALAIPRDVYRQPLLVAATTLLAAILGATLIGVLGGLLASRRLAGVVATLTTTSAPRGTRLAITEIEKVRERLDEAAAVREAAERDRRQSQVTFDLAAVGIGHVGLDGRWLRVNRKLCEIVGYNREELLARTFQDITYPDDLDIDLAYVRQMLAGEIDIYSMEKRYRRKDGSLVWINLTVTLVRKADGALDYFISVVDDIQRRKQAEDEIHRLNAELEERVHRRTAELEAANQELESFAYAVSHDLRAPLRAMSGFSQALLEDYGERLDGEARVYLDQITLASHRMSELIDGLLTLSRSTRGELRRDPVDLAALAERLLAEQAAAEPDRRVAWRVEPNLRVRGDPVMLEVVMRNLIENAWKYTAKTPNATIRVYSEDEEGERCFCVADNGAGFDMAHANRLFQAFQRLHRQDEFPGIGIGLATVRRIVHRHGGAIRAEGAPGRGATFRFTLPYAETLREEAA